MKKPNGIYVSPTQFAKFGQGRRAAKPLTRQIATRDRRPDFNALGAFLPNPDPVLKAQGKDIKIYRELRTEPQVGGNIRRRKGAVKALEWGIEKKNAKRRAVSLIEGVFHDLPLKRIISEMLDATLYGYQPMETLWEAAAGHLTPTAVIGKPPEWFHFDNENRLRFLTRESRREGELLPPYKFLLPRQEATYDNPYGFPDLSMVFWPTVFKKGGMTFWLDFSEKYGGAWAVGKLPRNTLEDEIEAFADRLTDMIQDAVAVIPDDTSVEIKEAGGKGASADIFERLLMFCRSEVNFALLGQNQASEASSTNASAKAGLEVTKDIRDDDKSIVEDTLNTLIQWIHHFNFGDGHTPLFHMWEQEEVDDVQAKRDSLLVTAGARFTNNYFRRAYGLEEDDLMTEKAPDAPGKGHEESDKGSDSGPEFSEGEEVFPDQDALDAALEELASEGMHDQAATIARPILDLIQDAKDYTEVMERLAGIYTEMDATALQETLRRAMFVSELWGHANGED